MKDEVTKFLENIVGELFADWPLKPEVEIIENDITVMVRIRTGKDFMFTQPDAQPLLALQHLLRLIFKKQFPDYPQKLSVDIGNFREQQLQAINKVAGEAIWQAKASGNAVHLSPMSSFERRLIHTQVANELDLSSESMGFGNDRHVVIKLKAK